jgi:hypothetical protein
MEPLAIEGTTDLDDEIENMLRPTLDEEPPSLGTTRPVSSWMLYSTLRLFAIASDRPSIPLFGNAEYPCFEFFCHHSGDYHHYTATTIGRKACHFGRTAIPSEGTTPRWLATHRCDGRRQGPR